MKGRLQQEKTSEVVNLVTLLFFHLVTPTVVDFEEVNQWDTSVVHRSQQFRTLVDFL